jgi:hypothetical protein
MSLPDRLYVNEEHIDSGNEYESDVIGLCLSPHPEDPADAVCWGNQYRGSIPREEEEFFQALADAWNERGKPE